MTPGIEPKQLEGVILSLTWQIFCYLLNTVWAFETVTKTDSLTLKEIIYKENRK